MSNKVKIVSQIFLLNESKESSIDEPNDNSEVTTNKSVSEVMATKSITEFVEKCEIDGKQWHRCKWLECNYSTVRSDSIVRHMRRHTGDRPYKCELCSYATIQSSALKIHIRRHTGEKPYKCNFDNCGKRFTVLATLLIHERTHTGLKPFKCKSLNCGYASIERSKLSIHMKKIHGLKPNQHIPINTNNNNNNNYVSNADEDVLKSSQLIPLNIFSNISSTSCENIQVEVDLPVFTIEKSTNTTNNNSIIVINSEENSIKKVAQYVEKRVINGRVWYLCKWNDCNYDTIRSDSIVRHIRSHTGEKPYKCHYDNCQYATIQRSALNSHLVWHTGEKPHKCHYENCSYKSIKRNKLQHHINKNHLTSSSFITHSSVENDIKSIGKYVERKRLNWFECKWNNCNYATMRSDCIIRHMRTHTGEKPYKCNYQNCSYATIQRSSLKKHISRHISVKS